jgi:20S proteasome subunit beta 7
MNFVKGDKKLTTDPVYVGSSVIGMRYKGGLVIACDTRMNYGSLAKFMNIDDRVQQINANTFLGSAGEYSDFQEVVRMLKEAALDDNLGSRSYLGPVEFTNYLSAMHYYRRNKMNPYWNYTVIGGIDWDGKPTLFSLDQFGTLLKGDYMLVGMAQYFCNAIIAPEYPLDYENFTRDQAVNLLERCFETLFYRDTRAGNNIKFSFMEFRGTGIPVYEEFQKTLKTQWNYERFVKQANEKIYLTDA